MDVLLAIQLVHLDSLEQLHQSECHNMSQISSNHAFCQGPRDHRGPRFPTSLVQSQFSSHTLIDTIMEVRSNLLEEKDHPRGHAIHFP